MEIVMKMLVGITLAALVATPAFAQTYDPYVAAGRSPYDAYGAVTPFGSPTSGGNGEVRMNAARAAAIRTCNGAAAKFSEYLWGDYDIQTYRSCMAQHGQAE